MPRGKRKPAVARKERVTIYVSPYMYKEIRKLIESGEFSSESDVGYMAISMFLREYKKDKEKKEKE